MKKYKDLYTDKRDELVFVIFLRTLKELDYSWTKGKSAREIIEICIRSRKCHNEEPYFHNLSYWIGDVGFTDRALGTSLFGCRLINSGFGITNLAFYKRVMEELMNVLKKPHMYSKELYKYGGEFKNAINLSGKYISSTLREQLMLFAVQGIAHDAGSTFFYGGKEIRNLAYGY